MVVSYQGDQYPTELFHGQSVFLLLFVDRQATTKRLTRKVLEYVVMAWERHAVGGRRGEMDRHILKTNVD